MLPNFQRYYTAWCTYRTLQHQSNWYKERRINDSNLLKSCHTLTINASNHRLVINPIYEHPDQPVIKRLDDWKCLPHATQLREHRPRNKPDKAEFQSEVHTRNLHRLKHWDKDNSSSTRGCTMLCTASDVIWKLRSLFSIFCNVTCGGIPHNKQQSLDIVSACLCLCLSLLAARRYKNTNKGRNVLPRSYNRYWGQWMRDRKLRILQTTVNVFHSCCLVMGS